jgi:hypothetical protein
MLLLCWRAEGEGEDVTAAQIVGLLSAVSGAVGTLFLFFGSFAYEQLSPYTNPEIIRDMAKRNKRRQLRQRIGLGVAHAQFRFGGLQCGAQLARFGQALKGDF